MKPTKKRQTRANFDIFMAISRKIFPKKTVREEKQQQQEWGHLLEQLPNIKIPIKIIQSVSIIFNSPNNKKQFSSSWARVERQKASIKNTFFSYSPSRFVPRSSNIFAVFLTILKDSQVPS